MSWLDAQPAVTALSPTRGLTSLEIYDDNYYAGRGADPLVDYALRACRVPQHTVRTV